MNATELKKAMAEDINTFKSLDLEIMEARDYYRANIKLFIGTFLAINIIPIIAGFLSSIFHWSEVASTFKVWENVAILFGIATFISGFIFLLLFDHLNNYVIFYHQIRPRLKTGKILVEKIKFAALIAYVTFAISVIIPALFFPPEGVLIIEPIAFFISGIVSQSVIDLEIKRIGISALFTVLTNYFALAKGDEAEKSK